MGSLLVGVMTAKALSQGWNVPIVAVNHLEGHLFANVVTNKDLKPPFLSVIVSGGHTEIILVRELVLYILVSTRDDAAGKHMTRYPRFLPWLSGWTCIDELAKTGDPDRYTPLLSPIQGCI